jgi:putative ABC transport system ATP-binding protein
MKATTDVDTAMTVDPPGRTGNAEPARADGLDHSSAGPLAACRNVAVVLGHGETEVVALAGIDLAIREGEALVLWGRSGSGKSTLLHVLGGLLTPTTGTVEFAGKPLTAAQSGLRSRLRATGIANVFQSPNLLPHLTAFENIAFAARVAAVDGSPVTGSPMDLLSLVGLEAKADSLPDELSGGEAQRVAIARALAQRPRLLLCDEPTGHLDSDTGERVLALIEALSSEFGFGFVLATHDADVAARYPREVELLDGRIVREEMHA